MPSSAKSAPPQQSSLTEMWGDKKKQKSGIVVPQLQSEENDMNIDDDKPIHGMLLRSSFPQTS
jgi:hypothetical protein